MENACCEFNVDTLRPTYKLLIGIPGKSNAFAISKKLGLPDFVIDSAKNFISSENVKFEDVITDLEISKKSVIYEQERAEQYRKEAERLKNDVEEQKRKINEQKEKILADARLEARNIYQQAKEESDRIIKELNRAGREKAGQNKLNEKRAELKNRVSEADELIEKSRKKKVSSVKPIKQLKRGDSVYIISFDRTGEALSEPDSNGDVMVQTGNMKIKVPLSELSYYDAPKEKEPKNAKKSVSLGVKAGKSQFILPEIDCRGQTVEEGIGNIDKYLDDAYLAGLKTVTIIHGKGTGVLRDAVQRYLKRNPHVKSFRPGVYGEGEMGVTVVELKNS